MKNFLIITNYYKDSEARLTNRIKEYIEKKGGSCSTFFSNGETPGEAAPHREDIPENTQGVLVLGGDGTLIRAAAALVKSRLPLIGVNLGTLGYLCELEEKDVFAAVDKLMKDDYMVEERMMLGGYGIKGGEILPADIALNDVVIHRTGALSVVNLIVYVNGEYLNTFRADGIIISTPTGSTGYNMSAGGPIVDPKGDMILLTPNNAHNLTSKSIVLSGDDEIEIEILSRREQNDELACVSYDGDTAAELAVGDRFVISKAANHTKICKLHQRSFLEILRKKMGNYS